MILYKRLAKKNYDILGVWTFLATPNTQKVTCKSSIAQAGWLSLTP